MTDSRSRLSLLAVAGAAALLAGCAGGMSGGQTAMRAVDPACPADGDLSYVCGVTNGEDIVQVGTSKWLIASSIAPIGGTVGPGRIYLIDSQTGSVEDLFPGASPALRHDAAMYPSCPALDLQSWDSHGLALRESSPGVYRLYITSHGALEAIQAFELDARGEKPTATWVGCVPLPERMFANSVAILDDGGFVTTKFMDPTDPNAFPSIMAGQVNGEVYEWRPGGAVTAVPGTGLSGPNGIELSADDRWMFVAAFGGRSVVRFDRGPNPMAPATVEVAANPDNLRWTEDGALLTVGGNAEPNTGWSVFRIDPEAMTATRVGGADQTAALQGAATALQVGDEIWIGTFNGDRVGILPAP